MNAPAKGTLINNLAPWTALGGLASMAYAVFTVLVTDPAVANGQLEARVTAVERQMEPLAELPVVVARIEERQIATVARSEALVRAMEQNEARRR